VLVTRACDTEILRGVTRTTTLDVIRSAGLEMIEQPFTRDDVVAASEAFITSATTIVTPVVRIDGQPVGEGRPGPIALRLRRAFHDMAERSMI
jgi:D-alanine transaminase